MSVQETLRRLPGMHCFGCASSDGNPHGLNLLFTPGADGKSASTEFVLPKKFQSYPGIAHGGIVGAVLDEAMGYVGVFGRGLLPFTRRFEVNLRASVRVEVKLRCVAHWVRDLDDGYSARAALKTEGGATLATSQGDFLFPTRELAERLLPSAPPEGYETFFRN